MSDTTEAIDKADPPTSFTAFKPVGHIVIGFADDAAAARGRRALAEAGLGADDTVQYTAAEMHRKMAQMLDLASGASEFGHEIVAMRNYRELAAKGCGWLVVPAPDGDDEQRVIDVANRNGASVAVKYGRLVITDLL